ncbi:MAG: glycosyltransferase family 2 protein [Clostridia bacterium]|nr:glycosyltransferase family 2 protein [Clostridia bacterium]
MTKISIIVPCRNGETYLPACIRSIQEQSFPDFELILINDASTDRTAEIMSRAALEDARIRVLNGEGRGVCRARNLGLSAAEGEWILFVDADDLLPGEALMRLFSETGPDVDMVIGAHETFGENQETVLFWPETRWPRLPWPRRQRAMVLRLIEGDSILNIMCNKLHRRSFLREKGITLNEKVAVAEDALFNLEAVLQARGCTYCHAVTYRYRMHPDSTMNRATGPQMELHRTWLGEMRNMLMRLNCFEAFYGAFVNSVTLRLYKDGGIFGVVRNFRKSCGDLVSPKGLNLSRMSGRDRRTARRIAAGYYPLLYPAFAVGQICVRKASEMAFLLRRNREMKALRTGPGALHRFDK